tara:strand:+ start:144263 stop:144502 length:240 start_codon:yes stop_codon:yes gene_type:complete
LSLKGTRPYEKNDSNVVIMQNTLVEAFEMASLIVRNIDNDVANALKVQARRHGISVEAEHRRILEQALIRPKKNLSPRF